MTSIIATGGRWRSSARTQLPLVVAITTIAVAEGHMTPATASSLVVAGILSTAIYPLVALRLRGDRAIADPTTPEEPPSDLGAAEVATA